MKTKINEANDSQHNFCVAELDPALLSTPFKIQTNWHVLTGAICCGKTTLIDMLDDMGFQTLPETSRLYLEREVAKGRKLEEIFTSTVDERALTEMQRIAEHSLEAQLVTFIDRALPDYLWFWRLLEMDPNELLAQCFHFRYRSVFILDQLPLQLDRVRLDNGAYTHLLDEWLTRDYDALGYEVVRVPVLPPKERVAFVLENLSERELIYATRKEAGHDPSYVIHSERLRRSIGRYLIRFLDPVFNVLQTLVPEVGVVEIRIMPAAGQQRVMRPFFQDTAVIHDDDPVGVSDGG